MTSRSGRHFFASVNRDATRPILPRRVVLCFSGERHIPNRKGICPGLIFSWISRISAWRFENKPWTDDQTDQISDYVSHLECRFAGKFVIVYLTPNGAKPGSLNRAECDRLLQENKLLLWAYPGVFRSWLSKCYKECDAEAVKMFLRNFIQYIDDTFRVTKEEENGE